jgi:TRAP transporter TAXI family solute receptor
MNFMKIIGTIVVSLSVLFSPLTSDKTAYGASAGKPFTLATAGTGGTFYVLGGAMSDMMRRYADTKMTPIVTNGSIENNRLVGSKRVAMAINYPDLIYYAYNGTEMYKGSKFDNLRYVCGGHLGATHVIVPKNSDVQKLSDLKGKSVAVGAQGSGNIAASIDLLGIAGLTFKDIKPAYLSFTEMVDALQDNTVDAVILLAGVPTSSVMNIFSIKEMRLVPYTAGEVNAYIAKQGPEKKALLFPYQVPANTYRGQKESVPVIGVRACIVTHKDVPDDTVYTFLKTIEGNVAEMAKVHPSGAEYSMQFLKEGASIPLHPGAEKFFKEKGVEMTMVR